MLSIGSNIGDRFYNLLKALEYINTIENTYISDISSIYETKAWGYIEQREFLNFNIMIKTKLLPFKLLKEINKIEEKMGRIRKEKWGERLIDIDIIFYGNMRLNKKELTIPHKYYKKRNFVLIPYLELKKESSVLFYFRKNKEKCTKYKSANKVLVSSCLLGLNCKYNGENNYIKFINKLVDKIEIIPVCPEQLGGMQTPRDSCEIIENRIFSTKGKEYTYEFYKGALETIKMARLFECKVAILKKRSPSCGFGEIYDGNFNRTIIEGNGITAQKLSEKGIKIITI